MKIFGYRGTGKSFLGSALTLFVVAYCALFLGACAGGVGASESAGQSGASEVASLASPDGKITASLSSENGKLYFALVADGKTLLQKCEIAMDTSLLWSETQGEKCKNSACVSAGKFGENILPNSIKVSRSKNSGTIAVPFGIREKTSDVYNQAIADFGDFEIVLRAYDDAVAYRFVSKLGADKKMRVNSETLTLPVSSDMNAVAHLEKGLTSSFENAFSHIKVGDLKKSKNASLPFLLRYPDGMTVALVESDVFDYPQMRIALKDGDASPRALFAGYPKTFSHKEVYITKVSSREDWLVETSASRNFPWRAFIVARSDRELSANDTVYKLARPAEGDFSWVKGGLCSWEWWNAFGIKNTSFKPGLNVDTYKRYVDFASANGIPFVLIDAGWLTGADVHDMKTGVDEAILGEPKLAFDVKNVVDYAHSKGVKISLWLLTQTSDKYPDATFALVKRLGADGVKIDFCNRDDAAAVNFYEKMAQYAAKYKVVLDLHGCAKPTGLQRTYPCAINFEGVRGNEFNKWSDLVTPSHNVDLIFTRMLCGPMDYTPGGMKNVFKKDFKASKKNPEVMGTRTHEMSKFVLYYAPFQMMCDSPDSYEASPDVLQFISKVPTVWAESVALCGEIGEYAVIARKSASGDWYVGGMNGGENSREIEFKAADFCADKNAKFTVELFRDSDSPDAKATDYVREKFEVKSTDTIKVKMIGEGGFVLKLTR